MLFKKKPKNTVALEKLAVGTTLTCNTLVWEIVEVFRYDWSTDGHSVAYKVVSKDADAFEAYLEVERLSDGYEVLFYESIDMDGLALLLATETKSIVYLEEEFDLEEHYKGDFKNETLKTNWKPVESFIFYNNHDAMLSVEKTEEEGCKAFYGFELDATAISGIINP